MAGVEGRVALVTGAGSADGIGFATARLLRARGARVAITSTTDRIFERLDELGCDDQSYAGTADLTDSTKVTALIEAVEDTLGPIDIVINNAGMVQVGREEPWSSLVDVSEESWRYLMDINLTSVFLVTKALLPGMLKRRYGRIVQMSSVTGPVVGIEGGAPYGAAKAALLGMARSLAIEAGPGVTVNCIGPGWIKTSATEEDDIIAGNHTPAGRPGTPEEVGHVAVFLASEEASYITGQLIVVDGGNTIQEYKVTL
jgi:3-oxoacyl-[acyl-carrier protein] reductase